MYAHGMAPPDTPPPFSYPRAGARGNPTASLLVEDLCASLLVSGVPPHVVGPTLVQGFMRFYRRLPTAVPGVDKSQMPALYTLLGSGTPPLKMDKEDAAYQDRPVGKQRCDNCSSAYRNLVSGDVICSQVCGVIEPQGWCRLWNTDRL